MIRNKRTKDDDTIEATWLGTYSDMVTLLLCFFILLFAMSTIDNIKFKQFIISFQSDGKTIIEYYNQPAPENITEESKPDEHTVQKSEDEIFEMITKELNDFVVDNGLVTSVSVYSEQEGVQITFNDSVLFDKGHAYLKSEARTILGNMAPLLYKYNRMIKVEGHTDNDPINNSLYPSNWELSTTRAVNVVKFFIEGVEPNYRIPPNLLQAAGYGEYHPLMPNDTEQGKALNRRIEIVILKNVL